MAKPKAEKIKITGGLEVECALRLDSQISALQDFIKMGQHDLLSHMHLNQTDFERILKMSNDEVKSYKSKELGALNQLMYAYSDLGEARDELAKIIENEAQNETPHNEEYNPSYR